MTDLNARRPIMTDMGMFRTTIMIESAERRGEMPGDEAHETGDEPCCANLVPLPWA
jgi:hypothetical protein